jgi:glycosyltransferase involved in cell wall biosynthesis
MNVSVVICTHNRADCLRETLRSLAALRIPPGLSWEVLVIDNNSSDHTRAVVDAAPAHLPCRYLFESRQGKSFALNAAIPHVDGSDVSAFTDDDVTMHPEWIGELWRVFQDTDCLIAGGRVVPVWVCPKPRWFSDTGAHALMPGVIVNHDHGAGTRQIPDLPYGANMAFRKGTFMRYGTFKTYLGPNGKHLMRGEDNDFCTRVRDGGGRILYAGDAVVYHPVDTQRMRKRYFQTWYFYYGRKDILMESNKVTTNLWIGVPRYLIRELARTTFAWVTTLEPRERFYHLLACWRLLGQIAEYYEPSRVTDST